MLNLFTNKTKKILLTKADSGIPTVEMYKLRRQLKKENKIIALETIVLLLLATMFSWGTSVIQLFGNKSVVYISILVTTFILCLIYAITKYNKTSSFYHKRMKRMSIPIITFDQEEDFVEEESLFDLIDIRRTTPVPTSNIIKFHI